MTRYRASFKHTGVACDETLILFEELNRGVDWSEVVKAPYEENFLQERSSRRIVGCLKYIVHRLRRLERKIGDIDIHARLAKGGRIFRMRIPKDIVSLLGMDENAFVEITLRIVGKNKQEVDNVKNR